MHQRPSYAVTTVTLTIIAVSAIISRVALPYIPPGEPNKLSTEDAPFLRTADHQPIHWQPLTPDTFELAARTEKPILLVIGGDWSWFGKRVDDEFWNASDQAAFINSSFVCIRVDADEHPEWLSAYLPVVRVKAQLMPGFSIWILSPSGQLFDLGLRSGPNVPISRTLFHQIFSAAKSKLVNIQATNPTQIGELQRSDLALIGKGEIVPQFDHLLDVIAQSGDPKYGGFLFGAPSEKGNQDGYRMLRPLALNYLLTAGRRFEADKIIRPTYARPGYDPIFGGCFRMSRLPDWSGMEYSKLALQNADSAEALALQAALNHDPIARGLATSILRYIDEGLDKDGYIMAAETSETDAMGRSVRHSFPPARLRSLFPDTATRDAVRAAFQLDLGPNPQSLPYLPDRDQLFAVNPKAKDWIETMRKGAPDPKLTGGPYLDINGHAVACMLRAARLIGDEDMRRTCLRRYMRLSAFLARDDVAHGLYGKSAGWRYLGDYLAYADASLEAYRSSGSMEYLTRGLNVLRRAMFLYEGPTVGSVLTAENLEGPMAAATSPDLADQRSESCVAQWIRLLASYSRVMDDGIEGHTGATLRKRAEQTRDLYMGVANMGDVGMAGFFKAAWVLQNAPAAATVGHDAELLSNQVAAKMPDAITFPASPPVLAALPSKQAGVYIGSGAKWAGPFTVDVAVHRLEAMQAASAPKGR
ncbi:MAG: thioredoxin domain-containing protein [Armatimonadetes bacterium]|nr:thioredoxin domain-containing protein [Armatimonadota bacterium]